MTSKSALFFGVGAVICLAIIYLFMRIRRQDALLDKMKKELQQQIQDEDIIQLTRSYLHQYVHSDEFVTLVHQKFPLVSERSQDPKISNLQYCRATFSQSNIEDPLIIDTNICDAKTEGTKVQDTNIEDTKV